MDNLLIVTGGQYHDFEANGDLLASVLKETGRFDVTVSHGPYPLSTEGLRRYGAVLLYANAPLGAAQVAALDEFVRAGRGLVGVHCANSPHHQPKEYLDLIGSSFVSHGPAHNFAVTIDNPRHDMTCRLADFRIDDELYVTEVQGEPVEVLATAHWQGRRAAMAYVKDRGAGRVVYLALGHDAAAIANRDFRQLLVHAADWALRRDERQTIGVGLIGYGPAFKMGKHHGDRVQATRGLRLVAACDTNPACLDAARADFPGIATYDSAEKMLENHDVDLAVIILPHHLHAPMALQCLEAGRHVVLEKPFCLTADQATRMIDAAKSRGLTLTVYHNRRFDGDFLTIRRAVEAGLVGEVYQAQICWCDFGEPGTWWRSSKEVSGGLLFDWGAHLIDWMLHILRGKAESVTGFLHKRRWWGTTNEDHGLVVVRFEGGRTGVLEMSTIARQNPYHWRILGTNGAIVAHRGPQHQIHLSTEVNGIAGTMQLTVQPAEHVRWYNNLAEHLLRGTPLVVRPEEARRVIGILEAVETSSASGRTEPLAYEDEFALPAE